MSPVIGVILLVAVVVALVALATLIVFDIGGDIQDTESSTSVVNVDETNDGIFVSVYKNNNGQFIIKGPNGAENIIW